MIPDINFKHIIARGGSQENAFEELCTQLARKTLIRTDKFERYRGDGGDGGVECISRSANNFITGWQAKFVSNTDDLIKQVTLSLATAVKIHPDLKKYIVCFPFDLTGPTGRTTKKGQPAKSGTEKLTEWIKNSVAKYKAQGDSLEEIEVWPANRLNELLLIHDVSGGIRSYFFSNIVISDIWFERNIATGIKKAGPRYSPELSVDTDIWKSFAAFGQTDVWKTIIHKEIDKVLTDLTKFRGNINKQSNDPVFPGLPDKFAADALAVCAAIDRILLSMAGELSASDLTDIETQLSKTIESLTNLEQGQVNDLNVQNKGEQWDNKRWRSFMAEYMVSFPAASLDCTRETLSSLRAFLSFIKSPNLKLASEKVFVLSGIGGSGKTHSICDISSQRLKSKELSCMVFGDQFGGRPDEWTRFAEAIGLKTMDKEQLLDALNAAAIHSGKPLIIFLDAINETIPRNYWASRIVAFADDIAQRSFLKLCVSCRSSFLRTSLPDSHPFLIIEHTGFKGFEREACNAFFVFYNLNPPLIPVLQPELSNPLYLKLVCSTLQAKGLKHLPTGWNGLLPVMRAFLQEKEKHFCAQYDLAANGAIVVSTLTAIVQEITNQAEPSLSWTDACVVISQKNLPINSHKMLDWLVKADLVIEDGSINENELASQTYIRPSFERLGDFLLATEIAKRATDNGGIFSSYHKVTEIFKDETSIGLNASLIAALSVILPENHGAELPQFYSDSFTYSSVAIIATKALIWRTPDSLTEGTRKFVHDALRNDGYTALDALFSICANESLLDATWLSEIFETTSLPYRDAFLSGYFHTRYNENGVVKRLIDAHHDLNLAFIDASIAHRWIVALIWLTASPDRRIKDTSTRAAIAILTHQNMLANDLLDQLLLVNDEEVVERLLLIIYAAQILNPDKVTLNHLSRRLTQDYINMPYMFNNALIRDHIRCIAELAQHLHCLPDTIDPLVSNQADITPGWMLQLPSKAVIDRLKKQDGAIKLATNSCLSDDFNHYSISCLDEWMYKLTKKQIGEWIIDDVIERKGLNNDLHNAYDITIVRQTGGGRSKPTYAERVGKKYQWNSLYCLASVLHNNLPRKSLHSEPEHVRRELILREERKIDPTLTQPYLTSGSASKNWWLKQPPDMSTVETLDPLTWLELKTDISAIQDIISVTNFRDQNWIPMSAYLSFNTTKKDNDYRSPYKLLQMWLNAYLVREKDVKKITDKLLGKNLSRDIFPSGGKFMYTYMGEYPWATACNTEPDWYLGVGDTFANTKLEMHNVTNEIVVEWEYDATLKQNLYLQAPSKKLFEGGHLWWNGKDGYQRPDKKTVFKDTRIETGGQIGMVADFDDLLARLKKLKYGIIWVLNGEKLLINHDIQYDRKYFSQYCWLDSTEKLNYGVRTFFESYDSKIGISE